MTADDDPDWEAEARRAEFWEQAAACLCKSQKIEERFVDVKRLKPDTRLVVSTFCEDWDPVEFTILEPESCKVLVKDGRNFSEPTEGTLLGSEVYDAPAPGKSVSSKRILLPGVLKRLGLVLYEVGGQKFDTWSGITQIEIVAPRMTAKPFDIWGDD